MTYRLFWLFEIFYVVIWTLEKQKQKVIEKKPDYQIFFLEKNCSIFCLHPDYDTDNSEDDVLAYGDEYGIVSDWYTGWL